MGNCYSLQKDHETALKNFQRAVQLDSRFAYAHTLCGHECEYISALLGKKWNQELDGISLLFHLNVVSF